jgi:hypothetical protein
MHRHGLDPRWGLRLSSGSTGSGPLGPLEHSRSPSKKSSSPAHALDRVCTRTRRTADDALSIEGREVVNATGAGDIVSSDTESQLMMRGGSGHRLSRIRRLNPTLPLVRGVPDRKRGDARSSHRAFLSKRIG